MDMFQSKTITPMLFSDLREAFDDPEYAFELKLDGIRCLAYVGAQTDLRNKRNVDVSLQYPELASMCSNAAKRCVLDGELIVMQAGKPDFFALQRRSVLTNKTKIKLSAKLTPVSFVAYDILYLDAKEITSLPLLERKQLLTDNISESPSLSVSRYVLQQGKALYTLTEQQELEGVVGKRIDSKYYPGRITKEWCKIKRLFDDDFVICGYISKPGGGISLVLGQYRDGKLVNGGHVSTGVSAADKRTILSQRHTKPHFDFTADGLVWIAPKLVGTVQWMPRKNTGLNQAVFKGLRDDKPPSACEI